MLGLFLGVSLLSLKVVYFFTLQFIDNLWYTPNPQVRMSMSVFFAHCELSSKVTRMKNRALFESISIEASAVADPDPAAAP